MLKGETFFNDLQHRNFFLHLLSAYHSVLQAGTAETRENMPKHERKGDRNTSQQGMSQQLTNSFEQIHSVD